MKHITSISAGGVVISKHGKILIVNQKNKSWSLPKGHVNEGEDLLEAAKREIYEESGINDLKYVKFLGDYQRPKLGIKKINDSSEIKHLYFFLFTTSKIKLKPIDQDNPEAKWVKKEDVIKYLTHPEDKKFFQSLLDRKLIS